MTTRTKRLLWLLSQKPKLRTFSGVPPLTFKAKKSGTLKNYRIYGNTVYGESVGDRTENLFDGNFLQGYWAYADGEFIYVNTWICTTKISCTGGQAYTYSFSNLSRWTGFVWYDADGEYISTPNQQNYSDTQYRLYCATAPSNATYMAINIAGYPDYNATILPSDITDFMLVAGEYTSETMPNYEPYGYRVPVTVTNGTDTQTTNLYLPEQIKMVGNEAEYVDYKEQKQHRVRKNLLQNTATSQTINGVEFIVNGDGSVTCNTDENGATSTAFFTINENINYSGYLLSGCPKNGGVNSYLLRYQKTGTGYVEDYGNGVTLPEYGGGYILIRINAGYTCTNLTFYPMIRKADIADNTYEPYIADTELDVTLPTLPTLSGTNTLSVGTEVQPSNIEITGKIKGVTA